MICSTQLLNTYAVAFVRRLPEIFAGGLPERSFHPTSHEKPHKGFFFCVNIYFK